MPKHKQTNVCWQFFFSPSILVRLLLSPMPCLEAAPSISHYDDKWEVLPRWSTTLNSPLPKEFSRCQHYLSTFLANPAHPCLPLTEKDAPMGRRIHLGGFFRGNTTLCGAVCWGSCRGGRGWPVPKGSRFPKDEESFSNTRGKNRSDISLTN